MAEGLLEELERLRPSLVVVSGDLTQRARSHEFVGARRWLRRIPFPKLVVPGNHDIPLYDLLRRFLAPLQRYRRMITPELAPWFEDQELAVLGLNTARSLTWKNGRISRRQVASIAEAFREVAAHKFKVLVTHHPFIPPPGEPGIELVGRAALALPVIDKVCIDLLLAGHLHHGYTGDVRSYYPATKRSVIVAQAGTAISHRVRHEPNGYNLVRLEGGRLEVEARVWDQQRFVALKGVGYHLAGEEWRLD